MLEGLFACFHDFIDRVVVSEAYIGVFASLVVLGVCGLIMYIIRGDQS